MRRSTLPKKIFMYAVGIMSLSVLASNFIEFPQSESTEAVYRIQDLGVGIYPNEVNDSGTVVGVVVGGNRIATEAFVWSEETGRTVLKNDAGSLTFANDISDSGLVVGHIGDDRGSSRAYSWMSRNTGLSCSPFEQGQSIAYAVNEDGYMAGQIADSTQSNYQAFRYDPGRGIRYLGTLGGSLSQATGLNREGEVVGWSVTQDRATHAFVWDEETGMMDLGTLGGDRSLASAINSSGRIVGQSQTKEGNVHASLFDKKGIEDLGTLGGGWSLASDINDKNTVIGQSAVSRETTFPFSKPLLEVGARFFPERFPRDTSLAVVWEEGEVTALNDLIPNETGWGSLTAATGINNQGQIVGFGRKNGHLHGFLLTPMDYEKQPTTLVLAQNTHFLSAN